MPLPAWGQVGPASGEVYGCGGVNDTEAVLVVEVVAVGIGGEAVHARAVLPAWVCGIVLAGSFGEDELEVAPGEVRVGLADEGGDAGDDRGRGGGAAEVVYVAVGVLGGDDAAVFFFGSRMIGGCAYPEVCAHLGVVAPGASLVDGACGGDGVEVGEAVEVGVVAPEVSVASGPDVEDSPAVVAPGDAVLDGQLPQRGSAVGFGAVHGSPAIVGDGGDAHVVTCGVGYVRIRDLDRPRRRGSIQQVMSVDCGAWGDAAHALVVVACGDEPGDICTVV